MSRSIYIVGLCLVSLPILGQDTRSYADQLRAIEEEMDSLSIFNLIDSLFDLEASPTSELNVRFSYTTNVTSAGRDYNINQSGFAPGLTYYHKSGFYGDLAGYWNSGTDPHYNPTILSIGYLGELKSPKWSFSLDGERWLYNPRDSSNNPLSYSLGGSLSYDFKVGFASVDYSYLFGKETAHRFITNLSGIINLGKWWVFQNITLYPSASMMAGNSDITQLRITNREVSERVYNRIQRLTSFANLSNEQRKFMAILILRAYENGIITEEVRNQLIFDLRNSNHLSSSDQAYLLRIAENGVEVTEYVDNNKFGVLNYAITLPLSLTTHRLNILLSYTYSIPIQLPGEFIAVDPLGYFGASISYRIPFK